MGDYLMLCKWYNLGYIIYKKVNFGEDIILLFL